MDCGLGTSPQYRTLFVQMAQSIQKHEEFKIDVENGVTSLLKQFDKREKVLERAMKDLEPSKIKFEEEMLVKWKKLEEETRQQRVLLDEERSKLDKEKRFMENIYDVQSSHVKLDVGGHMFSTSLSTLTRDKSSMLAAMFSGRHKLIPVKENTYFIDRDGTYFKYLLNYLRGDLTSDALPEDLTALKQIRRDADFFQLTGLCEIIDKLLVIPSQSTVDVLTQDHINSLFVCKNNESNCSDNTYSRNMTRSNLNFDKQTLSGLSFVHTTFVHNVSFHGANLSSASFYGCEFGSNVKIDFTHADLSWADFRQCRAFTMGQLTNQHSHKPPLYGTSCSSFLTLIQEKKIIFKQSQLQGAKFDPGVLECIVQQV